MIIDLSKNNGHVDFASLIGVEEIFIRASLGYGDKDSNLNTNATGAADAKIPVSYYHFAYPHPVSNEAADAMKQANYFVDTISVLPKPTHLAVDLENFSKDADATLSKEAYALWVKIFLETVEGRTGIRPIVYTYADYLNKHLPDTHELGKYPLWIANYNNTTKPPVPRGWTGYYMWQYSASGVMDGITGKVDLSKIATEA